MSVLTRWFQLSLALSTTLCWLVLWPCCLSFFFSGPTIWNTFPISNQPVCIERFQLKPQNPSLSHVSFTINWTLHFIPNWFFIWIPTLHLCFPVSFVLLVFFCCMFDSWLISSLLCTVSWSHSHRKIHSTNSIIIGEIIKNCVLTSFLLNIPNKVFRSLTNQMQFKPWSHTCCTNVCLFDCKNSSEKQSYKKKHSPLCS